MERQAELRVLHQREEAEGAVANPLRQDSVPSPCATSAWTCGRALADHGHRIAVRLRSSARSARHVRSSASSRIVEQVDVPRDAIAVRQQLGERHPARDVALAPRDAVRGYEPADAALEFRESHCRTGARALEGLAVAVVLDVAQHENAARQSVAG